MTAARPDLTVSIFCEDGSCTEFYQNDESSIARIVGLMLTPRLFDKPMLVFASERGVSSFVSRTIDVVRIQTPVPTRLALVTGFDDITEIGKEVFASEVTNCDEENRNPPDTKPGALITSYGEIHTAGAWVVLLRLRAAANGTIQDQRVAMVRFFDLPVVPFRLESGGVGFVNPGNISRMTMYPGIGAAPKTALPADLLRWNPIFARKWDYEAT